MAKVTPELSSYEELAKRTPRCSRPLLLLAYYRPELPVFQARLQKHLPQQILAPSGDSKFTHCS